MRRNVKLEMLLTKKLGPQTFLIFSCFLNRSLKLAKSTYQTFSPVDLFNNLNKCYLSFSTFIGEISMSLDL